MSKHQIYMVVPLFADKLSNAQQQRQGADQCMNRHRCVNI